MTVIVNSLYILLTPPPPSPLHFPFFLPPSLPPLSPSFISPRPPPPPPSPLSPSPSPAISKEDFLCAVDLIFSTVLQHSRTSVHSNPRIETIFGESEREKLASLSRDARKSRLVQLMTMLGEEFRTSTDEELLSHDESHTPSPPPVPPRKVSTGQLPKRKNAVVSKSPRLRKRSQPAGPVEKFERPGVSMPEPKENGTGATEAEQPKENGIGIYSMATAPDYNSDSSDFEHFIPPSNTKARRRIISEPPQRLTHLGQHSIRRCSSPLPKCDSLESSSAVLTRKPSWLTNKEKVGPSRRSKSLDARYSMIRRSIPSSAMDSDDNTGGSGAYARPFEHIHSWRIMLGLDSSVLTGSLPQIDKAVEESDLNATYLDPSEIVAAVTQTGSKLGRKVSRRVMKRVSTVLTSTSNGYYLPLVSTLKRAVDRDSGELPKTDPPLASRAGPPDTPYIRMNEAVAGAEKWGFSFPERPESGMSGYASDASSGDWDSLRRESTYSKIPELANGFENVLYDSNAGARPPAVKGDGVYATIKELGLDGRTDSQPSAPSRQRNGELPDHLQLTFTNSDPAFNLHDGYCSLDDSLEAKLPTSLLQCPPSLPPRNHLPTQAPGNSIAIKCLNARVEESKLKPPGVSTYGMLFCVRMPQPVISWPHSQAPFPSPAH